MLSTGSFCLFCLYCGFLVYFGLLLYLSFLVYYFGSFLKDFLNSTKQLTVFPAMND